MSPEAQRIAIAEACGWKIDPAVWDDCGSTYWKKELEWASADQLPDYLNDLNAMHEAEKKLTREQHGVFRGKLWPTTSVGGDTLREIVSATAAKRAEAFLRTLGKWVEE